jgi:putative ABC transport system permease protein
MSYPGFIWKNGTRNKRRTILTILSVALALFVLSALVTLVNEIDRGMEESNPLRLITHHAVSFTRFLPGYQRAQIEKVPGVVAVTPLTWFGGIYIDEAHTDFAQFACDPNTLFEVYPEIQMSPEQKQAFIRERAAVIVGRRKAEKHGWKIGDRIALQGALLSADLELTIRGIFSGTANDEASIYFHHDYLEEAWGRQSFAGMYWVRADSTESIPRVIEAIDAVFRNSDAPTKTETEKGFATSFLAMLGNLKELVAIISSVILFTILLVTGNTMAMTVRERTREIAVLKALGFRPSKVLALLMSEGVLMTLAGGLIGCVGAHVVFTYFNFIDIAAMTINTIQRFEVTRGIIALGLVISVIVGLLSTIIPAYRAARLTVADGLRHVG